MVTQQMELNILKELILNYLQRIQKQLLNGKIGFAGFVSLFSGSPVQKSIKHRVSRSFLSQFSTLYSTLYALRFTLNALLFTLNALRSMLLPSYPVKILLRPEYYRVP